jgi:hypothetical protein
VWFSAKNKLATMPVDRVAARRMGEHTVQHSQLAQLSQPEHLVHSQSPMIMVLMCRSKNFVKVFGLLC